MSVQCPHAEHPLFPAFAFTIIDPPNWDGNMDNGRRGFGFVG